MNRIENHVICVAHIKGRVQNTDKISVYTKRGA